MIYELDKVTKLDNMLDLKPSRIESSYSES